MGRAVFAQGIIQGILGCPVSVPPDAVEYAYTNDWNLCSSSPWRLVFHDEFNGDQLDAVKWLTYFPFTSDGSDQALHTRTSTSSQEVFLDENVSLSDGLLRIAIKNEETSWFGETKPFSGGVIYSRGNWVFSRGKFEIRCKIPYADGAPLIWPAFWLHGGAPGTANSESEIDVFEFCGGDPSLVKTDIHRFYEGSTGRQDCSNSGGVDVGYDLHTEFHTFAVEWDFYYIRWYVDGTLIRRTGSLLTLGGNAISDCTTAQGAYGRLLSYPHNGSRLNLIASCGVGKSGPNAYCGDAPQDLSAYPLYYDIDYIRVYQRNNVLQYPALYPNSEPLSVTSTNQSLCLNDIATITASGPIGNLSWNLGPGLTKLNANINSITVQANATEPTSTYVQLVSTGAPFPNGNGVRNIVFTIGSPSITSALAEVEPCGTVATLTCHAGEWDGLVNHNYWIDGTLLSESHNPNTGGSYPLEPHHAQVLYSLGSDPGDFCIPWTMRVENGCGYDEASGILTDRCRLGPCDMVDAEGVDEVAALIRPYPNPSGGVSYVHVEIDDKIDLDIIKKIEVKSSQSMELKWETSIVENRLLEIPVTSWSSGVYYMFIHMPNGIQRMKIQLKL